MQVGIGKNMTDALDALTRFVGTLRSGWQTRRTAEHPVPLFPTPDATDRSLVTRPRPAKRKRPAKGTIAHRSTAKGHAKPKPAKG